MHRFLGLSETSTLKSKENDSFKTCFIALGSNLNEPARQVLDAIRSLESLVSVRARSNLYRSPALPGGPVDQADYINAVVQAETDLSPSELLAALQSIEKMQGRVKIERWGPRIIDLDIISFDDLVIEEGDLCIPHKEALKRPFVLKPLLDISPNWKDPVSGISASAALDKLRPFDLVSIESTV